MPVLDGIDQHIGQQFLLAAVFADAGESVSVDIRVPERAFADWQDGWHYETGTYLFEVGISVTELPLSIPVTLN